MLLDDSDQSNAFSHSLSLSLSSLSLKKKKLDLDPLKTFSKKNSTDDPLPPGVTLPPDDLDDFGGLGSVLSLGRGGGGGGGQGHGAGTGGGTAAAAGNDAWQDLALGELQ